MRNSTCKMVPLKYLRVREFFGFRDRLTDLIRTHIFYCRYFFVESVVCPFSVVVSVAESTQRLIMVDNPKHFAEAMRVSGNPTAIEKRLELNSDFSFLFFYFSIKKAIIHDSVVQRF